MVAAVDWNECHKSLSFLQHCGSCQRLLVSLRVDMESVSLVLWFDSSRNYALAVGTIVCSLIPGIWVGMHSMTRLAALHHPTKFSLLCRTGVIGGYSMSRYAFLSILKVPCSCYWHAIYCSGWHQKPSCLKLRIISQSTGVENTVWLCWWCSTILQHGGLLKARSCTC